jgi:L-amino acid N-acyltransferase YncA
MHIRDMLPADYPSVAAIYQQGIDTQNATFETTAPDWETWNKRHLPHCRLVAIEGHLVIGFVALMPYSSHTVYNGVGVLSVYIHNSFQGQGVGRALLNVLHGFLLGQHLNYFSIKMAHLSKKPITAEGLLF